MFEFPVWYAGMIIEYVRADNLQQAKANAAKMFSLPVVVTEMTLTDEERDQAKRDSLALQG